MGDFPKYKEYVNKLNGKTFEILGAKYTLYIYGRFENSRFDEEIGLQGFSSSNAHQIHILDRTADPKYCDPYPDEWYINDIKEIIRHEIFHAFLTESGLGSQSHSCKCWAEDEEMVDWLAIQSPKIFKIMDDLDLLEFVDVINNEFYGNETSKDK